MKMINLIVPICTLFLISCGEKKLPETISPIQIEVDGSLGKQFILVDKEYSLSSFSNNFTIELERTGEALPNFDRIGVGIEIFDENGELVSSQKPQLEALTGLAGSFPLSLLQLENGDYGLLSLNLVDWPNKLYNAKTFKITIQANTNKRGQVANTKVSSNSDNNGGKWDKLLDSYESYVNQYIKLLKKAQSGDMTALSEYSDMLEKATNLSQQLETAKSQLTTSQASRFVKIQSKLTSAIK